MDDVWHTIEKHEYKLAVLPHLYFKGDKHKLGLSFLILVVTYPPLIGLCVFCVCTDDHLRVKPYEAGEKNQLWVRDAEGYIRNRHSPNLVIDIFGKYITYVTPPDIITKP